MFIVPPVVNRAIRTAVATVDCKPPTQLRKAIAVRVLRIVSTSKKANYIKFLFDSFTAQSHSLKPPPVADRYG